MQKIQNSATPPLYTCSPEHSLLSLCFVFEPFDSGILRGRTSLHWPCQNGHLEICQLLVENGADVNAKDDEYDTLLYTHALHTHMDIHWNNLFCFVLFCFVLFVTF